MLLVHAKIQLYAVIGNKLGCFLWAVSTRGLNCVYVPFPSSQNSGLNPIHIIFYPCIPSVVPH